MKKAKTKNVETRRIAYSLSGNTKSIATQTEDFDNVIEIAKLQEQMKLLQLENDCLRRHMKTSDNKKLDNLQQKSFCPTTQLIPKINTEISSCGCKGNCSSRCGCVKKNNKCNPSCKCDDKICQNQKLKHNHENKENIDGNDIKTYKEQGAKKNEAMEIIVNSKGLFNSDIENIYNDNKKKEKYKHIQEKCTNNIHPSFTNVENIRIQNLQTDLDCTNTVTLRRKRKEKKQNNDEKPHLIGKVDENAVTNDTEVIANIISCESNNSEDLVIFDPMKPRHQLSRTPPNSKKCADEKLKINDSIQSQSYNDSIKEMTVITSNIQDIVEEEEVDWEQHTAQLIPCKQCKRTFMPHRIQKHEACCKRI
ncbi:uncharacterized protein [Linepithema humile]|uniref:uncharacterized protein n=1 Tax=Linepithema humile TaxID=83485 RepID=UPI000623367B|nr:PREDICTED: uncharacterized protein LOC105678537 [Linepithema humile]